MEKQKLDAGMNALKQQQSRDPAREVPSAAVDKKTPTVEEVKAILEAHVEDPELGIDIVTLELVYDVTVHDAEKVDIKMTFTSPMCPFGPELVADVKKQLMHHLDFSSVIVEVVFDPPWKPSEELKAALGIGMG